MDSWRPPHRPIPRTSRLGGTLRQFAPVIGAFVVITGSIVGFGLTRGGSSAKSEEAEKTLLLAKALCDQGQPDKAIAALDEMDAKRLPAGEEGAWLRIRAAKDLGDIAMAGAAANAFLKSYPSGAHAADAKLVALSSDVATAGVSDPNTRAAVQNYLAANSASPQAAALEAELGLQEVRDGGVDAATDRFDRLFASAPDDVRVRELGRAISDANMRGLVAGTLAGMFETHKVSKGEAVATIAKKYGATSEIVLASNGIADARRLRIGQELRIPRANWTLHCDVGANVMLLKNNGRLFKMYEVRTGRDPGGTPKGTYKLLNKKQNPTWRPGDGRVYLPGDPNNELGTRWMSFEGDILGIHGTIHDETIGSYASNGCIGMTKGDVEELFDLVQVGTPLEITGEQDASRHKILPKPTVPPPQVAMN